MIREIKIIVIIIKVLWDVNIQCDHIIEARTPDIVIMNEKDENCFIVNIAIPRHSRLSEKEGKKVEKCLDLKREIMKMWNLKSAQVIPINYNYCWHSRWNSKATGLEN